MELMVWTERRLPHDLLHDCWLGSAMNDSPQMGQTFSILFSVY